jgi:hypothetical protein
MRGTKSESGGWDNRSTGQPPTAGQVVNPGADLVGHRVPHLAGGGAEQTELQLLPGENNNSSDLPARTGRLTSLPNCN